MTLILTNLTLTFKAPFCGKMTCYFFDLGLNSMTLILIAHINIIEVYLYTENKFPSKSCLKIWLDTKTNRHTDKQKDRHKDRSELCTPKKWTLWVKLLPFLSEWNYYIPAWSKWVAEKEDNFRNHAEYFWTWTSLHFSPDEWVLTIGVSVRLSGRSLHREEQKQFIKIAPSRNWNQELQIIRPMLDQLN